MTRQLIFFIFFIMDGWAAKKQDQQVNPTKPVSLSIEDSTI